MKSPIKTVGFGITTAVLALSQGILVPILAASLLSTVPAHAANFYGAWGLWQDDNHLDYSLQGNTPTDGIQYYGWQERPQLTQMNAAWSNGEESFLEMQTNTGTCLAPGQPISGTTCTTSNSVSSGGYDAYLNDFGSDLSSFNHPVLVTFDHEMNGGWYPWGNGGSDNATPANWIAAWRHVESVIHGLAPKAVFVWAPNIKQGIAGFDQYWPGQSYVQAVGLDGYLKVGQTWANTFTPSGANSISDITGLGNGNNTFFLAETGADNSDAGSNGNSSSYLGRIDDLVNHATGVANFGGIMYFDKSTTQWHLTSAGATEFLKDLTLTVCPPSGC